MTMNKKEKEIVETLKEKLSLRFTEEVNEDVPISESYSEISVGYTYNKYTKEVRESCSTSVSHNPLNNKKTDRQGGIELFSTKLLALKSLRNDLENEAASVLRAIDVKIEQEKLE